MTGATAQRHLKTCQGKSTSSDTMVSLFSCAKVEKVRANFRRRRTEPTCGKGPSGCHGQRTRDCCSGRLHSFFHQVLSQRRRRRRPPQPLSPKGAQSTWACVANGAGLDMDAPMMLRPCNCRPGTAVRARRAALGSAPTSAAFAARLPSARAQRSIFVAVLALPRRSHLRIESADQAARSRRGVCADGSALCQARSSHRLTAREA